MIHDFGLSRAHANAYPYHPEFFKQLREAVVRTTYFEFFGRLLPAHLVPKFQQHAATASLRELTHAVVSHVVAYPHRSNL